MRRRAATASAAPPSSHQGARAPEERVVRGGEASVFRPAWIPSYFGRFQTLLKSSSAPRSPASLPAKARATPLGA